MKASTVNTMHHSASTISASRMRYRITTAVQGHGGEIWVTVQIRNQTLIEPSTSTWRRENI